MKIALLGHMGRDEAVADRLKGHTLHIMGQHYNPGLIEKAYASGGSYRIVNSMTDTAAIAKHVQAIQPDMFLTNSDDALAAGVVDTIQDLIDSHQVPDILLPCPDIAGSRIEWDKFFLRELVEPKYNPDNFMVTDIKAARRAIDHFTKNNTEIVLKPRNLAQGKGVRVQNADGHFTTYDEAYEYSVQVLTADDQTGLEIQEKIVGHEFNIQLITDGKVVIEPPATYDYPYRLDGDSGPGTGGMGSFTMPNGENLPFIDRNDYLEAVAISRALLKAMIDMGIHFKGVFYPAFFKTPKGLKIIEVNARAGDPEFINIADLMEDDVDYGDVLKQVANGNLRTNSVRFKKTASAIIYYVAPEYGYNKGPNHTFMMDKKTIEDMGCAVRFAAAEQINGNNYQIVGSSRVVGISALADTPWEARAKIQAAAKESGLKDSILDSRDEIAQKEYIERLAL